MKKSLLFNNHVNRENRTKRKPIKKFPLIEPTEPKKNRWGLPLSYLKK